MTMVKWQFRLRINTDNAAFSDEDGGVAAEIRRILRVVAANIDERDRGHTVTLFDINGNNVGSATLDE